MSALQTSALPRDILASSVFVEARKGPEWPNDDPEVTVRDDAGHQVLFRDFGDVEALAAQLNAVIALVKELPEWIPRPD